MMKNLFFFLIPFFISSCGHTKYAYSYSIEESIDFSNGKWILNEAITNYKSDRIQNIALHYFREILKDSLFEINELRHDKLISTKTPFEPNTKELEDLKIGTECDYLINIKSILVKEEMSSFATAPPIGNTKKRIRQKVPSGSTI